VDGIVIVEGVSSTRTELGRYWDLAVWVTCSYERRLARGIARDGEAKRSQWENVLMPQEDQYVAAQKPEQRADIVVSGEEAFRL
jgi:uridine kinase